MESKKILIAEDDKSCQLLFRRLFEKKFSVTSIVDNGEEAVMATEANDFDIILMDIGMPSMNGFVATSRIRKIKGYEKIPIIAITGLTMEGDSERCLRAGATIYLKKPVENKLLLETVDNLLKKV